MKFKLFCFIMLCSTALRAQIVIEAENATLNGISTKTTGTVTYANMLGSGSIDIPITVPSTHIYNITMRVSTPMGNKDQDLYVNSVKVSTLKFPSNGSFFDFDAGAVYLKTGANIVTIKSNWGYMYFDKFTFTIAPPVNYFFTDASLIDPNATQKTKDVYQFLRSNYGENIISGQTFYWKELVALAQKSPVIRAFDMQNYSPHNPWHSDWSSWDDGTVQSAIEWYNSTNGKGIVSFQWHWFSPMNGSLNTSTFNTSSTTFDVSKVFDTTSAEYKAIIRDIDAIAVQLKRLQTENIPVIWRPLHEAGGAWFWWGAKGSAACLKLYDVMYDRLTNINGLHNLIWAWSTPEANWYPGNSKIDILGYDSYPGANVYGTQKSVFDNLYQICAGKKLIALTENGPIPDINACFTEDAIWSYFSSWSDLVASQNTTQHIQDVYNNTNVITLDKVSVSTASSPPTLGFGNDWVATDALGRKLPSYKDVGAPKDKRYIGMFYWLWHPYIRPKAGKQVTYPELLAANSNSPAFECNDMYWSEPENGFYHARDPWSTRRNLQLLANAGVDFIYIDFTNGSQGCDALTDFMTVALDMYNKGIPVPKVVFFLNEGINNAINCLMDNFYNQTAYQPLWFMWQGKPLLMADQTKACTQSARACTDAVKNFFTWRKTWAFDANQWNFLDSYPQDYASYNGVAEQMPVQKGMGAPLFNIDQGSSYDPATGIKPTYDAEWRTSQSGQGIYFERSWQRAHQIDPQIVCVTGWNELMAAAWPTTSIRFMGKEANDTSWRCVNHATCLSKDANGNHIPHGWHVVDEFNVEFNRDIEPMKGGYTDNYYYQLVQHIRKHKGMTAPQAVSTPKTLTIDGAFSEWANVTPIYKDAEGDCQHRNYKDVVNYQIYTNNSGRNDIMETRTTLDASYIYFYVKTATAISPYTDSNWMMLYINSDTTKSTGWEGFDYVLNMEVSSATQTTVKERVGSAWNTVGSANYRVVGNEMEIVVPRELLGFTGNTVAYYYQLFDNPSQLDNIEDNFVNGESAPDRRFNYSYANAKLYIAPMLKQNIALAEGWNLISTNVRPKDSTIATVFNGLDVLEIKDMNAFWRKGQNDAFNSLKTITSGEGYLVNMNVAGTLSITGTPLINNNLSLSTNNWNLIGCPYQSKTPFSQDFNATNCSVIKDFNGFWIPNGTANSLQNLEVGKGYFIKK